MELDHSEKPCMKRLLKDKVTPKRKKKFFVNANKNLALS